MIDPTFLTLTMRSTEYALAGIREMRAAFTKFRRTKWWAKVGVRGGIAGMEITHGDGGFHPHIHALLDCPWLSITVPRPQRGDTRAVIKAKQAAAQKELCEAWAKQLGHPVAWTWVKRAAPGTEREVIKYSVSPAELLDMGSKAVECIRAMTGNRLVSTWGSCYRMLKQWVEEDDQGAWIDPDACCEKPAFIPDANLTWWKMGQIKPITPAIINHPPTPRGAQLKKAQEAQKVLDRYNAVMMLRRMRPGD